MSVSSDFSKFCSNLGISAETISNISYRYKRMTKRMNLDFWGIDSDVRNSLYVGSYGRNTDIVTSDIDVLLVLPYATYQQYDRYSGNGQSALLQAVKACIENTYKSYIRADGQVVKVDFTDGICFELVPAFENANGSFTYPDTNNGGSWKTTNPRPEIKTIADVDNDCNGNLKNLCKMARAWKYEWDVPMGGLLIDTLAHDFMKSWQYRNNSYTYYDWMTRDFLAYLASQRRDQTFWYAVGSNQKVYRKGLFEAKAEKSYKIACEAIQYQSGNYEYSARKKWREVYGTKFPS